MLRHATLLAAGLVAALALPSLPASAQLLSYDGFGNGPLANLQGSTGGTGWTSAWASGGDNVTKVQGAGLTWPGLATASGAAFTPTAGGTWPNSVYTRSFGPLPPGTTTLYVSFLMRDDAAWGMWGGLSFGSYPYEMTVGSPLGYYSYGFMLSEGLADISNKPLVRGETTLVVVRVSKNAGAGVTWRMYLDPAVGAPEPGFPDAQMSLAPLTMPTALSIDNGTGFTTDEIRVGTTWASVLPGPDVWNDLGLAKAGSAGLPQLAGVGPLSAGSANAVNLAQAASLSSATLVFGVTQLDAPFKGGTLVPLPQLLVPLATDFTGHASLPFTLPAGVPAGTPLIFQAWIQDAGASFGLAASNGLEGVTG